ncbi:MAG: hypothetical protein M0C28_46570 [Candidatus Moduliflexus flocculans]|nr:hypothetical protein [Candidatus Moduliflexus flocculans]
MAQFMAEKAVNVGRAAGNGAAEPLRAPHRAHGRGRARRRDVGEHRRRVHEDGHHRGEIDGRTRPAGRSRVASRSAHAAGRTASRVRRRQAGPTRHLTRLRPSEASCDCASRPGSRDRSRQPCTRPARTGGPIESRVPV